MSSPGISSSTGHQVLNIDQVGSPESYRPEDRIPFLRADVTDFGQALESLSGGDTLPGIEAVVHLAAIPSPAHATADQVFRTNVTSTHAVFSAARRLGLQRIVWASSETTLGLPFEQPPDYAPVDEKHLRPESSYALSKVVGEEMARQFHRWSGIPIIGLRFSNVMIREDYNRFAAWQDDAHRASGTCGAMSTRATSPRASAARWRPRSRHRQLHHRRGRHGHAASQPGADGRGLPGRPAGRQRVGQRHAARHQSGTGASWATTRVQLAGSDLEACQMAG